MKMGILETLYGYLPIFVLIIAVCFVILLMSKLIKSIKNKTRKDKKEYKGRH